MAGKKYNIAKDLSSYTTCSYFGLGHYHKYRYIEPTMYGAKLYVND